jgi:hypothetical protein
MLSIPLDALLFVLAFSSVAASGYVLYDGASPDGSVIRGSAGN